MQISNFSFRALTLTAALLLATTGLYAQATGIKGKIKNLNGDGIGGATVTARLNGKDLRTVNADKKGEFLIDGLEPGVYNLVVDANGYSSGVKYGVEVAKGKVRDLGDRLILTADRGSFVIIDGGVFFKDGTRLAGATIKLERVSADGSLKKIGTDLSNGDGDFAFRLRPVTAKFRITASYDGKSASKDLEVDNAAVYHVSLSLDVDRPKP